MKISVLSQQIAEREIKKGELQSRLATLNAQYEGIRNRRTPEIMEEKAANRSEAAELRTQIKNINHELQNLEWELNNRQHMSLYRMLWILSGILVIAGIVLLTIYKYRLGLFGLTDTHDLVAIIKGGTPVMNIDLYKSLFWINYTGTFTLIVGLIGLAATSLWYIFYKMDL